MPEFIQSLDLNEQFFDQIVSPMMAEAFPDIPYVAARLGGGSDVLGFDTEMSMDHDWGIRMQLFLAEEDHKLWATAVHNHLRHHLPYIFLGFPVHFGEPDENGTRLSEEKADGPVEHRIEIVTLKQFFKKQLNFDPYQPIDGIDWLTIPQQLLLEVTQGRVLYDPDGELAALRQKFAYFPRDVWLYLLACQWGRIAQEEHFVGRTGFVGDEIGSHLLGGRLVHDLMLLCFLMEKHYAPYAKWFGTAFKKLNCASKMTPILEQILAASTWQEREKRLCQAYSVVAKMHNGLAITEPMQTECVSFFDRPFHVLYADSFKDALLALIQDPQLKILDSSIGSIDQFSHSTDLKSYPHLQRRIRGLYL